jgi:hypothetical protein
MASKRPRVLSRCPADQHSGPGERIIEFSFSDGKGGLISLREATIGDVHASRRPRVEVYRTDGEVEVIAPKRTLYAAYSGSAAGGSEITLHATKRAALIDVVNALGIDVLDRAYPDGTEYEEGEDDTAAVNRVLATFDEEDIIEWLDSYCSSRADDWHINEVEV